MNSAPAASTGPDTATFTHVKNPRLLLALRLAWFATAALSAWVAVVVLPILYDDFLKPTDAGNAALAQMGLSPEFHAGFLIAFMTILMVVFFLVAGIIFWRRSDDWLAILVSLFLLAFGTSIAGTSSPAVTDDPFKNPLFGLAFTIVTTIAFGSFVPFLALFPDGQLTPRWTRYLIALALVLLIFGLLPRASPLFPENWPRLLNLLGIAIIAGGSLYAQIYRYRRVSGPSQRQQTKWLIFGLGVLVFTTIVSNALSNFLPESRQDSSLVLLEEFIGWLSGLSVLSIPLALGIAILRYRLWDIDLLINRSLVYGAVTALALAIFFVAAWVLQVIAGNTQPLIAALIALLVAGVFFNAVRSRVQRFVDRRIYGFRFDLNEVAQAQKMPQVENPGALTGRTLGAYHVLGVIGKGGMGEVYKGQADGQTVAIKILPEDLAGQVEFRTRFEREARMLSLLDHPNIVKLYASGESEGVYYMAMELVEGQELGDAIRQRGRLPLDEARAVLGDITSALDYAHAQGLVHRDIKPSNIMLRLKHDQETQEALLMDFGVVKVHDARTRVTGTGAIGTIDYMAPEQIMAAKEVDRRADIYALGVVLYEMLIGERPFKGSAAQVLFAHIQQPAPDPRDTLPDLPRDVAKAVMQALEKKPEDRFASAGEFAAALV